jgi:SAM-dependent methyltransferase
MDHRRHAPAAERNRGPILDVLRRVLPARGTVLEIASGTGQHVAHFAAALPDLTWQPSDRADADFASITAWCEHAGARNALPPVVLDVTREPWPVTIVDAIYNANMIHISPWQICLGLLRGAGTHLAADGVLVLYGPYKEGGAHTAPSNAAFDADLRTRDPSWGVRDLEEVARVATAHGLVLREQVAMPANNLMLVFHRAPARTGAASAGRDAGRS